MNPCDSSSKHNITRIRKIINKKIILLCKKYKLSPEMSFIVTILIPSNSKMTGDFQENLKG